MKTQLRKPARDRASYTDQYKQEERIGATVICGMAGLGAARLLPRECCSWQRRVWRP